MKRSRHLVVFALAALSALGLLLFLPGAGPAKPGQGHPSAKQKGYTFTALTFLSDPAPGGDTFVNDFELDGLNNRGQVSFTADVSTGGERGYERPGPGVLSGDADRRQDRPARRYPR
jgi:hypothetical protein